MYKLFEEPEVLEIEFEPFEFDGALVVLTLTLLFEVEWETAPLPPVPWLLVVYDWVALLLVELALL